MQALGVDIQTIQSIVGHADTEITEHYLHVQESIRQSAIQLFSEAFSAWKLDGTALIIASQLFKSLASTLARISQQMMLRSKKPTYPCDWPDKIFGIVVKIVVKTKCGQPINKKKSNDF